MQTPPNEREQQDRPGPSAGSQSQHPNPAQHRQPQAADRPARHRGQDGAYTPWVQAAQRRHKFYSGIDRHIKIEN